MTLKKRLQYWTGFRVLPRLLRKYTMIWFDSCQVGVWGIYQIFIRSWIARGIIYDALVAKVVQKSKVERILTLNIRHFKRVWYDDENMLIFIIRATYFKVMTQTPSQSSTGGCAR